MRENSLRIKTMRKILFLFLLPIILTACNFEQILNQKDKVDFDQFNSYIEEIQNLKDEVRELKEKNKEQEILSNATSTKEVEQENEKFNFNYILTKHLYKAHYSSWYLIGIDGNIEIYSTDQNFDDKSLPYKNLFFRKDKYFIMHDEEHGLRTGGLTGKWNIIIDKNILKIFFDNGLFWQYKILDLDESNLKLEKIDDDEILGDNIFPPLDPKLANKHPEWRIFEDEDISFSYPKTFCGTSWQELGDANSCDREWRAHKRSDHRYYWEAECDQECISRKEQMDGADDIFILPSYSSYGAEFEGDIVIYKITEDEFQENIKNAQKEEIDNSQYVIYARKNIEGIGGKLDEYYLSGDRIYLRIKINFPAQYSKYTKFLLESIKEKSTSKPRTNKDISI